MMVSPSSSPAFGRGPPVSATSLAAAFLSQSVESDHPARQRNVLAGDATSSGARARAAGLADDDLGVSIDSGEADALRCADDRRCDAMTSLANRSGAAELPD